jgi:hypothetical protein
VYSMYPNFIENEMWIYEVRIPHCENSILRN